VPFPPDKSKPTQFTSENNPGAGRPKGSRNRSTIVREILDTLDKKSNLPIAEAIAFALAKKALKGDVNAAKELYDSGFGKVVDEQKLLIQNPAEIRKIIGDDVYEQESDAAPSAADPTVSPPK